MLMSALGPSRHNRIRHPSEGWDPWFVENAYSIRLHKPWIPAFAGMTSFFVSPLPPPQDSQHVSINKALGIIASLTYFFYITKR
jgi:hypothetical protein